MQGLLRKPSGPSGPLFVFDTQPLAKPPAGVLFHRSVGLADRPQAEVVGPTIDLPVERCYQRFRTLLGLTPAGYLADRGPVRDPFQLAPLGAGKVVPVLDVDGALGVERALLSRMLVEAQILLGHSEVVIPGQPGLDPPV